MWPSITGGLDFGSVAPWLFPGSLPRKWHSHRSLQRPKRPHQFPPIAMEVFSVTKTQTALWLFCCFHHWRDSIAFKIDQKEQLVPASCRSVRNGIIASPNLLKIAIGIRLITTPLWCFQRFSAKHLYLFTYKNTSYDPSLVLSEPQSFRFPFQQNTDPPTSVMT